MHKGGASRIEAKSEAGVAATTILAVLLLVLFVAGCQTDNSSSSESKSESTFPTNSGSISNDSPPVNIQGQQDMPTVGSNQDIVASEQLNTAENGGQNAGGASSDETAQKQAASGFDTPSSGADAVDLRDKQGIVNRDAALGGMPPASAAGGSPSPTIVPSEPSSTPTETALAPETATPDSAAPSQPDMPAVPQPESSPTPTEPTPAPATTTPLNQIVNGGADAITVQSIPEPAPLADSPATPAADEVDGKKTPIEIDRSISDAELPVSSNASPVVNEASGSYSNIELKGTANFSDTVTSIPPEQSAATASLASNNPDSGINSLDDADRILDKMDWGQMAFNVPASMPVKNSAIINLLISPTQTTNQLVAIVAQEVADQGQQTGRVESASLKVTGKMEAHLVGSDAAFDIKLITPEVQMLSRSEPTEWKWQIDSKLPGSQNLHLTINAIFRMNGEDQYRTIRTYDRVIKVNVTPAAPLVRYWPVESVIASLIAAGCVWFLRKRAREKQRRNSEVLNAVSDGADIFLSYSRRDQDRILPFVERLRQAGFKVWIDQGGIDGAVLWAKEITDAIRHAKAFILMASPASFASDHVTREVSLAVSEQKPILPVYLESVEMPPAIRYSLAGIQHIDLYRGNMDEKLALVIRSLEKLGLQANKPLK